MKRCAGFTLIEVMLVLVILLVLATLAYPKYVGTINKTRRIEAQVAMIEALQAQERYQSQHNTYLAFSSATQDVPASGFKWWSGATAASSAYELEALACPGRDLAECVELRATPGTAKVDATFAETECGTLTLNTAGEQSASGSAERCWP